MKENKRNNKSPGSSPAIAGIYSITSAMDQGRETYPGSILYRGTHFGYP